MHISSSQWNIKYSSDLIFSSKDFSLYISLTPLVPHPEPNFGAARLFTRRVFDWLMRGNDQWGNQSIWKFMKAQWSLIYTVGGLSADWHVGLIPAPLIEIRDP